MRRAARRDRNESALVARLKRHGFSWLSLSQKGRPDGYAARKGRGDFCEIKMPGQPYTQDQMEGFAEMAAMGIPVFPLETKADVDAFAAGTLKPWTPESVAKVWSAAGGRKSTKHRPGKSRAREVREQCWVPHCATSQEVSSSYCTKHKH